MLFRLLLLLLPCTLLAEPWGKDSHLIKYHPYMEECVPERKTGPLIAVGEILIGFHKNIVSPADGPRSHFYPTSSQYALDAIRKYGFFQGVPMGCDRLMRENSDPWIYRTVPFRYNCTAKYNPVP